MKKAAISFSFDDGRGDNFAVFQDVLFSREIPVTINITTGYIDDSCPRDYLPSGKSAMSADEVRQLAADQRVEIALHGDQHQNTEADIAMGREKLISWLNLPADRVFGFASPGSGLPVAKFTDSESELFTKQVSYLRTSLRISSFGWFRVLCRKAGRVLHIPLLYRIAYADTLMDSCYDRVIYSIPVMKDATFDQVKSIVDLAIRRKKALTLMFHSILPDTAQEDNWSWDRAKFEKLCDYVCEQQRNNKLMLCTTQQILDLLQG